MRVSRSALAQALNVLLFEDLVVEHFTLLRCLHVRTVQAKIMKQEVTQE